MTANERMLRLTKMSYERLCQAVYLPKDLALDFDMLEPAPPKGFLPWCHDKASDGCAGRYFINGGDTDRYTPIEGDTAELFTECQQCPWRKKEVQ